MFKHLVIACLLAAPAGLAYAVIPLEGIQAARVGLKDCVTSTRADSDIYTAELLGGMRVEIVKSPAGTPSAIRIAGADGSEATVTNVDDLMALQANAEAAADIEAATETRNGDAEALPDARLAGTDAQASRMARAVSDHFHTLVQSYCQRALKEQAARIKPGARAEPESGTDWALWPDLLEDRARWYSEARYQVEETFYYGMDNWSSRIIDWIDALKDRNKVLPACSAVRDDCRSTCDRVGTYAGGVVCGGLAAVASALSAGVGVSVGVYCGGRVLQKIEECRFNCVMPGVPCSN